MHVQGLLDMLSTIPDLFKMEDKICTNSGGVTQESHRCGLFCLGPLTFHMQAVGERVSLSQGGRLAERAPGTFRNGLVFSSRPLKVRERLRLRVVQGNEQKWHGALRVGFTNVPPMSRAVPLPSMAIPDLTDTPGHWAAPLPESLCRSGSELEFWVSSGGSICFKKKNDVAKYKLKEGVDLCRPLWAMVDIYGKTCSILLLGSELPGTLRSRRSCPTPEHISSPDVDNHYNLNCSPEGIRANIDSCVSYPAKELKSETVKSCVACMAKDASVTLRCGHTCLCHQCTTRVIEEFGTCPLCRRSI